MTLIGVKTLCSVESFFGQSDLSCPTAYFVFLYQRSKNVNLIQFASQYYTKMQTA